MNKRTLLVKSWHFIISIISAVVAFYLLFFASVWIDQFGLVHAVIILCVVLTIATFLMRNTSMIKLCSLSLISVVYLTLVVVALS